MKQTQKCLTNYFMPTKKQAKIVNEIKNCIIQSPNVIQSPKCFHLYKLNNLESKMYTTILMNQDSVN